jgi:outer membrane lipoprotein-sorting protein
MNKFTTVVFLTLSSLFAQAQTAQTVLDDMLAACDRVQTLIFTISKKERMVGRMSEGSSDVKYRKTPFSTYFKSKVPDNGLEVIFVKGWNDNKAFINPGGFPYINVSLSPLSSRMRADGHFTVYDLGFETLTKNLRYSLQKTGGKTANDYTLDGTVVFQGRTCDKLVLEHKNYAWSKYTVPKNIDLHALATEMRLSAYAIKERNNLTDWGTLKAGTVITIPTTFIKKLILYIDKTTHLPLVQEMYDDKGFFARYEFTNVQLNPKLDPMDFNHENKAYNF